MSREAARSCRSLVAKAPKSPLEVLSVQLATGVASALTEAQQQVNAAVASGQLDVEAGQQFTDMTRQLLDFCQRLSEAAEAQNASTKRVERGRRVGARERALNAAVRMQERDLKIRHAADELRHRTPKSKEFGTTWLAEQLAPKFSSTPASMRKKLNELNIR